MTSYWARLRAYLRGDQGVAEDIDGYPKVSRFSWVDHAASNPDIATYAAEAAKRGAEVANEAVTSIQTKAGSLLTVLLTILPISFVVTGFALSSTEGPTWTRIVGFALMVVVDLLLMASAALAFIASGLQLTGGLNVERLARGKKTPSPAELKAEEANAWHLAAQLAMWKGPRLAKDLFHARRLVILGLAVAIVASPFIVVARSGVNPLTGEGEVDPTTTTSPSPSPS